MDFNNVIDRSELGLGYLAGSFLTVILAPIWIPLFLVGYCSWWVFNKTGVIE